MTLPRRDCSSPIAWPIILQPIPVRPTVGNLPMPSDGHRLRQGHHEPRNLWEHREDEDPRSKSGHCVGRVDSAELAAEICYAVNAARSGGTSPAEPDRDEYTQ